MKGRFDVEILNVYLTRIGMARIEKGAIVCVCNKNGKYIFIFKPCTFYQVQGVEPPRVVVRRWSERRGAYGGLLSVPLEKVVVQGDLTRAAYKSAANFTLGF